MKYVLLEKNEQKLILRDESDNTFLVNYYTNVKPFLLKVKNGSKIEGEIVCSIGNKNIFLDRIEKVSYGDKTYFSLDEYHNDKILTLQNNQRNLLFIDLEMTLGLYKVKGGSQEIIQSGYILTNPDLQVIKHNQYYIKPARNGLRKRTIKFLKLNVDVFNQGARDFSYFYEDLNQLVLEYNPLIITWGESDKACIKNDCFQNNLEFNISDSSFFDLLDFYRHLNLMQYDSGLFNVARQLYGFEEVQIHDAFADALVLKDVYQHLKEGKI
jgi:inhibitor of KinA sporulation pathway (predicted exonuclease)